jgi:hypothetical protein
MPRPFDGECSKDGCSRPIHVLKSGLCATHYLKYRRSLDTRVCSLEWCDKTYYARGLCQYHHQRQSSGLPFIDPNAPKPECLFSGCGRDEEVMGFCRTHYMQHWLGKRLTPIRSYSNDNVHDENRKCKTCGEWKEEATNYYRRSNGNGYQSECKTCAIKRNSAHQERRKLEKMKVQA